VVADAWCGRVTRFVTGVILKSTTEDGAVLEAFRRVWDPLIQPALGM
jgi:hypothetical protein